MLHCGKQVFQGERVGLRRFQVMFKAMAEALVRVLVTKDGLMQSFQAAVVKKPGECCAFKQGALPIDKVPRFDTSNDIAVLLSALCLFRKAADEAVAVKCTAG